MDYTVVTARQEIQRAGEALPVEPKVYDLILYLLERRDRAVSKEELQEAIWPNVIVTESALTRCIMKARILAGDDGKEQSVIRTAHARGYRFVADVAETIDEPAAPVPADGIERITVAVLPFRNLSDDDDQAFLADGLTQDIITDLSRNSWLMVVARGSSDRYTQKDVDYRTVSSELGARYLVEGSVRRVKDTLRVNTALTNAATGAREWSERYDQPVEQFFEIQDEIVQSIAASLGSHVRRAEGTRADRADPETLDVWGLLHKGMAISWSRFSRESNLEAEDIYRKALELSPDSSRAMAFLACSVAMKVSNGWSTDIAADSAEAWAYGQKAIKASPEDPMILGSVGHTNTCLGKAASAVDMLNHAIDIDPSSSWVLGLQAFALTAAGRAEEALKAVGKARRLSPRDAAAHWHLSMYSWAYVQLGQYEDAAREAQNSINAFAGWQVPWATLAVARAGLGQWDDAREAANVAAALEPVVDNVGYSRFFRFIVRDEARGDEIESWLQQIWPASNSNSTTE